MPRQRHREYQLSAEEMLQFLDFADSDEEGLFELDEEDEELLEQSFPQPGESPKTIQILDPLVTDVNEQQTPEMTIDHRKWTRKFPANMPSVGSQQDKEWGKIQLDYEDTPTPLDVFQDVCKLDELIDNILVPQSIVYTQQKGIPFKIEKNEMKAFIGINIMMSYHVLPELRDYFSNEPDLRVQPIAETMTRDRMYSIRKALHFSDNSKAPDKLQNSFYDRAWKIRPLIDHFNAAFQNAMSPTFEQAIDERMVKFKGQNIMKQYMKDKPIQRGFKHWCRNDAKSGYLFEFDIYVGRRTSTTEVGLSESVVTQLTKSLSNSGCHLFFDNFYTSPALVYRLMRDSKIFSCGTVRQNRKGLPKDLKLDKELKKGEIEARYYNGMSLVKWLDTKVVMMLSTIDSGIETNTVSVKRRQKGKSGKVDIQVPAMVQRYNKFMRGTDLLDQKTNVYAFDRKSPGKYYCRPFWDYIDMGIVNSFIVYQKILAKAARNKQEKLAKTQKDFRREIALSLIGNFSSRKKQTPNIRKQNNSERHRIHYAEKHGRCRQCYVKEKMDHKGFIKCLDCDVYLCLNKNRNCWEKYHE